MEGPEARARATQSDRPSPTTWEITSRDQGQFPTGCGRATLRQAMASGVEHAPPTCVIHPLRRIDVAPHVLRGKCAVSISSYMSSCLDRQALRLPGRRFRHPGAGSYRLSGVAHSDAGVGRSWLPLVPHHLPSNTSHILLYSCARVNGFDSSSISAIDAPVVGAGIWAYPLVNSDLTLGYRL